MRLRPPSRAGAAALAVALLAAVLPCEGSAGPPGTELAPPVTGGINALDPLLRKLTNNRRLLIIGAMTVVRAAVRKGAPEGSWLQRMLARKPTMLVAIALANKMARSVWAMLAKGEDFRVPAVAAI